MDATRATGEPGELWSRARACYRLGGLLQAQALCERLLESGAESAEVLKLLAVIARRLGLTARAEQLARRAVRVAPRDEEAIEILGDALVRQGRHEEAITVYRQAVRVGAAGMDALLGLGMALGATGRLPEALEAYREAADRHPGHAEPWHRLGLALAEAGRLEDAIGAQKEALRLAPLHVEAVLQLATLLHRAGRADEARDLLSEVTFRMCARGDALAVVRHWARLMPDDPVPRHRLAAWSGKDVPSRAADAYVANLFDLYAERFDEHLRDLGYRAPALIGEELAALPAPAARQLRVLDAGCGTGLCGLILRPYARHLTGVDLSPGMVERARARHDYDELVVEELTAFLERNPGAFDLIVSADTLVYFGELARVCQAAAAALRPGGRLLFTVERSDDASAPGGWVLDRSGRYRHSAGYLDRTLSAAGLGSRELKPVTLRQEADQPVSGYLVQGRTPGANTGRAPAA